MIAAVAWLTIDAVVDQWGEIESLIDAGRSTLADAATDTGIAPDTAATIGHDVSSIVGSITDMRLGGEPTEVHSEEPGDERQRQQQGRDHGQPVDDQ